MTTLRLCICIFILSWCIVKVPGQSYWCERKIEDAQLFYKQGKIDAIPGYLMHCLEEPDIRKDQKKRIFRLLANSYIATRKRDSAEWAYVHLLRQDPVFLPNPDAGDLPELLIMSGYYRNTPVWEFAIHMGMDYGRGHLIHSNQLPNITKSGEDYVSNVIPFRHAIRVQRHISPFISFSLDVANAHTEYSLEYDFETDPFQFGASTCVSGNYSQYEKTRWISVPVGIQYYPIGNDPMFRLKKYGLAPYIHAAFSTNFVFDARLRDLRINFFAEDPRDPCPSEFQTALKINTPDIRRNILFGAEIGLGLKLKIDRNFLFVEFKYLPIFTNMARNPQNTPDLLTETFRYIDNDFNYRAVSASIGFSKALYKPKKLEVSKYRKLMERK